MFTRLAILLLLLINGSIFAADEKFMLITGCARSGTQYITKVMQLSGLDIMHENVGYHGSASWLMAVEDVATPYGPGCEGIKFQHVLHQVRDPLKVISSVYTTEPKCSWEYIIKHIPQIRWTDPRIVKCAKYWYYWNLKSEEKAELTYRIEDLESEWGKIEKALGLILDKSSIDRVPKDTNSRGPYKKNSLGIH